MRALLAVAGVTVFLMVAVSGAAEEPELDFSWTWVEAPLASPVIDRGPADAWDHYAVDNPYVYCENGRYYCFFEAQDKPFPEGGREQIGLATSIDGIAWQKTRGNPIFKTGPNGAWDHVVAKLPAGVICHEGSYYMLYSGRDGTTKQIGMARADSPEGPWSRAANNPVLKRREDCWDRHLSTYPAATFRQHGVYCLLYRGMQDFYRGQGPGLAVSEDLFHWRRAAESDPAPLIPVSEEIASFAVARVGDRFIGISQPMDLARRCYWISDDLIHWTRGPAVRFHASTKAETLSNPYVVDGQWNVLYEQGDRIYRAVLRSQ